jgi:hypothetical protein
LSTLAVDTTLPWGDVQLLLNVFLEGDAMYFQASGLTEEEHARVRAAEVEAKRKGEDHRLAGLMAVIGTGKVRTVHVGRRALERLQAWATAGGGKPA